MDSSIWSSATSKSARIKSFTISPLLNGNFIRVTYSLSYFWFYSENKNLVLLACGNVYFFLCVFRLRFYFICFYFTLTCVHYLFLWNSALFLF